MRRYHELTKHTVERLRSEPHFLDWENQPLPFKIYTGIAGETLPLDPKPSTVSALAAVAAPSDPRRAASLLDRRALARLLHFSLGVVHRRRLADGRSIYFRAAPCTGALYHVDAYVACGDLHDVSAGLYHFGPHDGSLRRLRSGDWRGELVDASGDEPHVAQAPVIIVLASTYWRNAWKYRSRAWRHVFWDSGTILAQLLAQAAADGWSARLVTGFADAIVEKVCGLDGTREGAVVLVPVGGGTPAGESPPLEAIRLPTETLSRTEVEYPMIADAHAQSGLADGETAHRWRAHATAVSATEVVGELHPLPPPALDGGDPLETVILRRGSTRTFVRKPVSSAALATMLALASAPLAADYRRDPAVPLVDLFLIVHAVEGVPPGAYRWHPRLWSLERIAAGDFRREAGFLGLGQELAADAAVNVYAIADLDRVLGALGNRGYRAATLDGAVSGGRLYLAAYAQRLGATGLTFFDDEVARFFGLDPGRFAVTFLTAAGVGARL